MAEQEQVERLRRSVDEWNQWRHEHPEVYPNLRRADLRESNLSNADLSSTDLRQAKLNGANLTQANPSDTILSGADLSDADLSRTNLSGAYLNGVKLNKANLAEARFRFTNFAFVDLDQVKGLERAIHDGPSPVSIYWIKLPHDEHIRRHFLRNTGFPDTFIDYMPSLLTIPIKYHSLFLSHSQYDQTFCKRLYNDLQNKGVRCWFASHDLRPGTSIVRGIEEAIHMHEKLLLILSHHATMSNWVQQEVEAALYKEVTSGQEVLFPIRLDNTVLESETLWAKRLRQRHIGDFTGWQDDATYDQAFTTLLRHLKVTTPPTL